MKFYVNLDKGKNFKENKMMNNDVTKKKLTEHLILLLLMSSIIIYSTKLKFVILPSLYSSFYFLSLSLFVAFFFLFFSYILDEAGCTPLYAQFSSVFFFLLFFLFFSEGKRMTHIMYAHSRH